MATQRIPLVGSLTNRVISGAPLENYDQTFVNCFPVVTRNRITGAGKVDVLKRQGFALENTLASSGYTFNMGACVWNGYSSGAKPVFSMSNVSSEIVRFYDANGTQIGGDITSSLSCISLTETKISGVSNLVAYVVNNASPSVTHAYYYPEGGAWTQISDADFPANFATPINVRGDPVHINGVMIAIGTDGKLYNSDLNSLANWTATSYLEAQRSPDAGRGLRLYRDTVVALGADSIEFFQYSGNATGSVLSRIPGAVINIGVADYGQRESIIVGDKLFVIGTDAESQTTHVYRLNGYTLEKISNVAVDNYLNATTTLFYPSFVGAIRSHGTEHLMTNFTSTGGDSFMCYALETGVWWRMKLANNYVIGPKVAISDYLCDGFVRQLYKHGAGYQDNGTTITMTVQLASMDHGTSKKKVYHAAELICDKQSTSGNISISWSDDDYATFSTARTIDPSSGTRRITRLGGTKRNNNNRRAWKIEETVNRPFRGEAIVLDFEVGQS